MLLPSLKMYVYYYDLVFQSIYSFEVQSIMLFYCLDVNMFYRQFSLLL